MAKRSKKKVIREMERQDAEGISRQERGYVMTLKTFAVMKIILILAIPIVYFVYSPALIIVLLLYVLLFFAAVGVEHGMNTSFLKHTHLHINKIDSAVALIVIVLALIGTALTSNNTVRKPMFADFEASEMRDFKNRGEFSKVRGDRTKQQAIKFFTNLGSCLTGERSVFGTTRSFDFGSVKPPEDFVSKPDDLERPPLPDGFDPAKFKDRMPKFSVDDLPLNYLLSSSLSSVNTVLIFTVSGLGVLSLVLVYFRKRKLDREMSEVIVEGKIAMLDDAELQRILSFGEEVPDVSAPPPTPQKNGID